MRRGEARLLAMLVALLGGVAGCRDTPPPDPRPAAAPAAAPAPGEPVADAEGALPEPAANVPWSPPAGTPREAVVGGQWFGPASGLRKCWPDRLTPTPCPAQRALRERVRAATGAEARAELLTVMMGWLQADAVALRHAASWSLANDFAPTAAERTPAHLEEILAALGRETDAIAALSHATLAAHWWSDARPEATEALLSLLADRAYRWPGVRAQLALRARHAEPRVAATLGRVALDTEEAVRVRRSAISALRRMAADAPTRAGLERLLVKALRTDAPGVAGAAAEVLGHAGVRYEAVAAAIRERAAEPGFGYDAGQGLVGYLRSDSTRPGALALTKALLDAPGIDGSRKRPALEAAALVNDEAAWALIATHASGADAGLAEQARALIAARGEGEP